MQKKTVKKTGTLFIILGAGRKALFTLSTENTILKENKIILLSNKIMEHAKSNTPLEPMIYHHYPKNKKLCIVNCLKSYMGM